MAIIGKLIIAAAVGVGVYGAINTATAPDSCYFLFNCAADKIFHPVICKDDACTALDGSDAVTLKKMYVENHGWDAYEQNKFPNVLREMTFYKAWLEFRDAGSLWSSDQKKAILAKIAELKKENRPLYLVAFVHGWHHNADDGGSLSDLARAKRDPVKFDYFMARQADQLRRLMEQRGSAAHANVLGIFVGWRGDSVTTFPFNKFTIGNRAAAADRLARNRNNDSLYITLRDINAAALDADPNARMLIAGHSLGGRVLSQMLVNEIVSGTPEPLGKNTQILALEPAVGADCYDRAFGPNAPAAPKAERPTFISISSQDDTAISRIYPFGSIFLIHDCSTKSSASGVTIGNHDDYLTHTLIFDYNGKVNLLAKPPEPHAPPAVPKAPDESPAFSPANSNKSWYQVIADRPLAYTMRDLKCPFANTARCYDRTDADYYTMRFRPNASVTKARHIWNLRTDRNTINFLEDGDNLDATHNGYISTNLARLMVEIQFPHAFTQPRP
jgi:hypothetical protein